VFFFTILGTWNWNKALFTILIGLCIIGIILAVVYMIIGKRFKKNKRAPPAATTTTTTQAAATRGISPKQEYSPVPTSV
jgi:mannose/fructose/N-acetylgalactosamine-specific phosphotransferase system component IIC